MAKKKKTSAIPTTSAVASGCPPPASELSAQVALQPLKALNSLLLKETVDLREQIRQLRSNLAAVSADHCIDEDIERDVCAVVVSSDLASTVEGCAALIRKADDDLAADKAAAGETTASLATELCLPKTTLLAVSREQDAIERDLSQSDLDEKRMTLEYLEEKLRSMEQVLAQYSISLIAADADCRKLEEEGMTSENSLHYAMLEISSLKISLEQKNVLTVKLTRENEEMKEEGKIRDELLQSAMLEIDSLKMENEKMKDEGKIDSLKRSLEETNDLIEHATSLFKDEAVMKSLKAVPRFVASTISSLEEKCSSLNENRNQLTDGVSKLKIALDNLKKGLIDEQKKSKLRNLK